MRTQGKFIPAHEILHGKRFWISGDCERVVLGAGTDFPI